MEPLQDLTLQTVIDQMDDSYNLCYVDYSDNLNSYGKTVQECIDLKCGDPLFDELNDCIIDMEQSGVSYAVAELRNRFVKKGYDEDIVDDFFTDNVDAIREEIEGRNRSDPLADIIRNTREFPVRIELISNYDTLGSHWDETQGGYSYEDSYFGDIVDALNLYPRRVLSTLSGHGVPTTGVFPYKPRRSGKELVDYEQLNEELENSSCDSNILVFLGTINLTELFEKGFNLTEVVVPEGNRCGLFSSFQGGGSVIEMTLLHDLRIDLEREGYPHYSLQLDLDMKYSYSLSNVYGVSDSFFGKSVILNPPKSSIQIPEKRKPIKHKSNGRKNNHSIHRQLGEHRQ